MFRYKCVIAYDGSRFSGYQIQPEGRTVQGVLESTLQKIHKGEMIKVTGSGRTDAGVHAQGQVIHFDSPLHIPVEKWPTVLNGVLPNDIAIKQVLKVDNDFHARFSVTQKEYRYKIYTGATRDPFKQKFYYHYPYPLDIQEIKAASEYLLGTHDFTSFCSAKTEVVDKVRTISEFSYMQEDDELIFTFIGNGFLYNMVRILVGTLLEIGNGKIAADQIPVILEAKNRASAGKTAPAEGLYLWKVYYN